MPVALLASQSSSLRDAVFAQRAGEWQSFFALAGGASATLIGLLFVALSLNPATLASRSRAGATSLAGQSFADFLFAIAVSFMMLIPRQTADNIAIGCLIIGGIGAARALQRVVGLLRERARGRQLLTGLGRYLTPLVAHGLLLYTAAELYQDGRPDDLGNLVPAIMVLMLSAAASAWALLLQLAQNAHEP